MEWYMSRDRGEMIVPQNKEQSEQSLSQNNSFQWGEDLSMCAELPASNYGMWGTETRLVGDWLDYQFDGLNGMDQMNDNFMNSFLEQGPPHVRNTYQSGGLFSESQCDRLPFDNLSRDQSTQQDHSSRGNLKYIEVPSSKDWDKVDGPPTCISYDSENGIGSFTRNARATETNTSDEQMEEVTSLEETVLQDLKMAMTQLTEETRVCFRDALYRLANNSRQQQEENQSQSHSGESIVEEKSFSNVNGETSKFGREEHMDSKINYYESRVAHLMFDEMKNNSPYLYRLPTQRIHYNNHGV